MKSIDFRVMYFLILYPSQSGLVLWMERIAVNVEIVGSRSTIYLEKNVCIFFINHAHGLHDFYKTYV